jgi:hypothetical protein
MAYTTIDDPSAYFQTALYTGNASSNKAITNDGNSDLQPDWVWIKERSSTSSHFANDSVRGAGENIYPDLTGAEGTNTALFTSFNSDGFTVGNTNQGNQNNETYVAWQWKAGGSASSNSDGSITSSVSASTAAGFSVVSYTATNANATVGHGLGQALDMLIVKNRDSSKDWRVWFKGFSGTERLELNNNEAKASTNTSWNGTVPSSSVFSLGDDTNTNNSTDDYIAYCFAGKKGYSKFGSYTGNGNADGTFVYTGFKPTWVMFKRTDSTSNWTMLDTKRSPHNLMIKELYANHSNAEAENGRDIDCLSNGIKIRSSSTEINADGGTYIYMAFAENPFVTSTGIPATAR